MKILLVANIDPWCSVPCGIRGYSLGLIKPFLKKKMNVTIMGFSTAHLNVNDMGISFINILEGVEKFSKFQAFFDIILYIKSFFLKMWGFFSDFDIIHIQRIDLALPFVFYNKPVICTFHGKASEQALEKHGMVAYIIVRIIEKIVLTRLDYAIAVSDDIYNYYVSKYPWCSNKILVVGNGVDTSVFKPLDKEKMRQKFSFSSHEKIILYLGRFHEEKNLQLLISSFNQLLESGDIEDLRLVLVGEGNTEEQLSNIIKTQNLTTRVTIIPPVSDSEVPEVICCADVFALTSVVEGFPLVILQALACGVPVVSTNVGDIHRVVKNYETGFLVDDFSYKSFAECLKKILLNTNGFKENAIRVAKENSWESVANETVIIYNKVLKTYEK